MPDRWGRPTFNDFSGFARDMGNLQAMGRKQKEWAEEDQFKADTNANYEALKTGGQPEGVGVPEVYEAPGELKPPALKGTPASQIQGKAMFATEMEADRTIAEGKESLGIKSKQEQILAWLNQNGGVEAANKIPSDLTAGIAGQKAFASVLETETQKAEYQQRLTKSRMEEVKQKLPQFNAQKEFIQDALLSGREDDVVNGLIQMSKDLPIPYQLGEYNPEDKTFDVRYFDRRTGELQSTRRIPRDELVAELKKTGEREFAAGTMMHWEAKRIENLKAEANPIRGKTKGGTSVLITPQIPPRQADGNLNIFVKDEKTGQLLAEYKTWGALYDSGTSVEDLKRDKDLGDIALNEQQILTSASAMRANDRSNQGDGVKAQQASLNLLSKQFKTALEPFLTKGGGANFDFSDTDEEGNLKLSGASGQAFSASQEFFHKHQQDWQTLSPQDQTKFAGAKAADSLYKTVLSLGQVPGRAAMEQPLSGDQGGEGQPKQAKDGKWYVQKDGEWYLVEPTGEQAAPGQQEVKIEQPLQASVEDEGNPLFNRPWDETPLGKMESAVKGIPSFMNQANQANKEALERAEKKRTYGSSIPSLPNRAMGY